VPLRLIQMTSVVALATCDTEGDWTVLLLLGPLQHFGDGGLITGVKLAQKFMSSTRF
jgi:hypothetical protein